MSAPICPVHMCKAKRPVASIRHSPDHQVALVHTELRPAPVPHKESCPPCLPHLAIWDTRI
eukprot:scaffold56082_cov19-Tisochrysis_lutea.AAC.1